MLAMLLLRQLHKLILKTSHLEKQLHLWKHSNGRTAIFSTTKMTVISGNRNFTRQLKPQPYTTTIYFICLYCTKFGQSQVPTANKVRVYVTDKKYIV